MLNHPHLPGTVVVVVVVVVIYLMKMTKKIAEYVLYVGGMRQEEREDRWWGSYVLQVN